ncbi:hypothetical protein IEQ34_021868 [Dendrobium chrysotoxum]|uniref:Bulb-type lectin domain-containing protein n=1 Tax=Dendrobium chrysotoxum TaxID=161865 RepID=A0AAV7FXF9_DENCH|nr:hypothetical protein IEQ34_021868 [Dendrobium chrysotoxum]
MAFSIRSETVFVLSVVIFSTLAAAENYLLPGDWLNRGASLQEGKYTFTLQEDCNLVLYNSKKPVWASETANKSTYCFAILQPDGNFVITESIFSLTEPIWASNTGGKNGNYVLILQRDGNVVLYSNPIFSTGTNKIGSADVVASLKSNRKVLPGAEQNKVFEMKKVIVDVAGSL